MFQNVLSNISYLFKNHHKIYNFTKYDLDIMEIRILLIGLIETIYGPLLYTYLT